MTCRIALASYPRSGNTWMRYLVECATGRVAGSTGHDRFDWDTGAKGEPIVLKTHQISLYHFDKAIRLVRNPYDAIASYFEYRQDFEGMRDIKWVPFFYGEITAWKLHVSEQGSFDDFITIRYEDLLVNPRKHLIRALYYIGWDVDDAKVDDACQRGQARLMKKQVPQKFMKRAEPGHGIQWLGEEERKHARFVAGDVAKGFGYEL